jgi:hypothetical protein
MVVTNSKLSRLGDNIDTIKRNTEALIDVSKEGSQEENAEITKYMLISYHQNARQNHDMKYLMDRSKM